MKLRSKFHSLQYKLVGMIVAIVVFPLLAESVIAYIINAGYLMKQLQESKENAVGNMSLALDHVFYGISDATLEMFQQEDIYVFLTAREGWTEKYAADLLSYTRNHISFNQYIMDLSVLRKSGKALRTSDVYYDLTEEQKKLADEGNGHLVFGGIAAKMSRREDAYVFMRRVRDYNNLANDIGYLQVMISTRIFGDILDDKDNSESINFLLKEGEIMIASRQEMEGHRLEDFFDGKVFLKDDKGSVAGSYMGKSAVLTYAKLDYDNWYLVNCSEPTGFFGSEQLRFTLATLVLVLLFLIIICALLARRFSQIFLKPLITVADSMKRLEECNYSLTIPENGDDEITILARSFNKMSGRIHELLYDVYQFQIREKNAQIKALQAYINPHFLYNTLDTICWMSRMEDAMETSRLTEALSNLLRETIRSEERTTVVEQELEYTKNYLMIQECRYSDQMEFAFEVEPGLENYETVHFALQPLIENAIVHGIEPMGAYGHINIKVYQENNNLVYSVSDDGIGTDVEELNELIKTYDKGQKGMAIAGLNSRIKLCYGEKWGVCFELNGEKGVRAIVIQPLIIYGSRQYAQIDDCG